MYHCTTKIVNTTVFTCAISILCYPRVTFIILYYFLRPRLKMLKFLLYRPTYQGRLGLMCIYASLIARHLTYNNLLYFLFVLYLLF